MIRNLIQAKNFMLNVEIIVQGCIDKEWCEWLGGLAMTLVEPDQTLLTGVLPDQAAVYGVIARLRDLGIPLSSISITASEPENGISKKIEMMSDDQSGNEA